MTIRKIDELIKISSHPLETHFDIEEGSTEVIVHKRKTELEPYSEYDAKDAEIEQDYQAIMDTALDMADKIKEHIDQGAEAKFLARLAEVAGQQLNIALSAIEKKARLKDNKDKFVHKKTAGAGKSVTNNNLTIFMERNAMLREILESSATEQNGKQANTSDVIDVEFNESNNGD